MRPRNVSIAEFCKMQAKVRGTAQRSAMTNWKDSPEANHSPMRKVSGSTLSPRQAPSPYKSKWEASYASKLELEKRAGLIKDWRYEPMSLKLAEGKRYRPDFLVEQRLPVDENDHRTLELIDVKGWHKNKRDAMTHIKWAAQLYPMFIWRIVYRTKGGGWNGEYV